MGRKLGSGDFNCRFKKKMKDKFKEQGLGQHQCRTYTHVQRHTDTQVQTYTLRHVHILALRS